MVLEVIAFVSHGGLWTSHGGRLNEKSGYCSASKTVAPVPSSRVEWDAWCVCAHACVLLDVKNWGCGGG